MRHFNEAKKAVIIWQYQYFIVDTAIAVTSLVGHVANVTDLTSKLSDLIHYNPVFSFLLLLSPYPPNNLLSDPTDNYSLLFMEFYPGKEFTWIRYEQQIRALEYILKIRMLCSL